MASEVDEGSSGDGQSLRRKVVSGAFWNAGGRLLTIGIQMLGTVILARLLSPADFGLFAMTLLFVGFAAFLGNWGLANAIIQRRDLTKTHLSTAFWMNQFVSLCITAVLWIGAPAISEFFGEPDLVGLVRLVAFSVSVQMAVVPIAILEREFRFRAIAIIETVSLAVGLLTAVLAALAGMGAASLALQSLALTGSWSALSMLAARWLPLARPSWRAFRELFSVSGWLAVGNIVGYWSDNADTLGLGRTAAPDQVGFYNRAYNLLLLPVQSMVNVLARVMIPALARMQDDDERSRAAWLQSARIVALATFPTCVGMVVVAPALVETLWGSTWQPVVPLLQALALAGLPWTIALACEWVLLARGHGRRYFVMKCVSTAVTVVAVLIGLSWGPIGVALAMLIRAWLVLPAYVVGSLRELRISMVDVAVDLWRPLAAAAVMGVLVWSVGQVAEVASPVELALQVIIGVASYAGVIMILDRPMLGEAIGMFRKSGQSDPGGEAAGAATPGGPGPHIWPELEEGPGPDSPNAPAKDA